MGIVRTVEDLQHKLLDASGQALRGPRIAFPNNDRSPAVLLQLASGLDVALDIAAELGAPVFRPGFRPGGQPASGMLVPEAAVDEHCGAIPGQDNVGIAREILPVKPEAEPL